MTLAYWCVLFAAYLPIAWTGLAKFGGGGRDFDNAAPREYLDRTGGWRKRAHWVQLNGFEAFPPFAAAVIIAHLVHAPQGRIDLLAVAFIVLRILYGLLYMANLATLRSVAWIAAVACVVALFMSGT
ncbi:MAG: MAPEG family protein [Nevskia sp.]